MPLLVWFLVGRIQRRAATLVQAGSRERFRTLVQARFGAAFLWAGTLALAFTLGHPAVPWIFFGAFAAALLAGAWRAEYVLGFALGMSASFGAVLPVLVASLMAACAFAAHLAVGAALRLAGGGRRRGTGLP